MSNNNNNLGENEIIDVGYVGVIVPTDYDETDEANAHAKRRSQDCHKTCSREPALTRPVLGFLLQSSAGQHRGLGNEIDHIFIIFDQS